MKFRKWATCLLMGMPCGSALAQQYDPFDRLGTLQGSDNVFGRDRNVGVTDRPRPDYATRPIQLGSWTITPQMAVEANYNDNIYYTRRSTVDDIIMSVRPRLTIARPDPNLTVAIAGEYEAARYMNRTAENTDTYALKGDLRSVVRRDTVLNLRLLQAREAEARFSPDSLTGIARPTRFDITEVYGEAVHIFNRLRVRGTMDYERRNYHDNRDRSGAIIDQDFRDHKTVTGSAIAEYALSPSLALFVAGSVNRRSYAARIGPVPARDSRGYEAALGASMEIGRLMRGSVRLGYLDQDYKDPMFTDVSGLLMRGELAYFVTSLVTLTAKVDRSVVESGLAGSAGYLRTGYSLRADYELLRNLILLAELGRENRRYNGIERSNSGFTGRFAATYMVSPRWALRTEFSHRAQESAGASAGRTFAGNQVMLSVVFKGL
ncbi:outer membrane beta-barrel protein [Sphingobium sp. BYY-5]|uniref:outer membrane beta-barrel protein n=1 Tax=Sphingobium sp. BYY-5 TaxID=2926400 RepID=UPI001FA80E39|nr:outer membrane beta-barrel protein [Sphingobium sp. BYY-5]MCI4592666.1 outer membrane beta-barrel protein [Sphingobium sp. BYY-5]